MVLVNKLSHFFLIKIIIPKSSDKDHARREFILNVLLVGLIILSAIAFIINITKHFFLAVTPSSSPPIITGGILVLLCSLLTLSRSGRNYLAAYIFVSLLLIIGIYLNSYWGADLPVMLLFFSLMIVITGILINTRAAFLLTILSSTSILFFTYLEIIGLLHPNNTRKVEMINMTDSLVNVIILGIIAVVSWLSNREMEKALKRAQTSEAALRRQRDNLEIVVEKRTQELKIAQVEKLMQMYRFAEFGKLTSGFFHDLVNPLNLVSLNLQRLQDHSKKLDATQIQSIQTMVTRAMNGTNRIESFINAARKQMQDQVVMQIFSLREETQQALQLLDYKAKKAHVAISFQDQSNIKYYGNPFKFNQFITNIVSNAIDAYDSSKRKKKTVEIRLKHNAGTVQLEIQDWGSGIEPSTLPNIFDPLFTTKLPQKGMGLGLSICKNIIEKDFKGTITIQSEKNIGTIFSIAFPLKKAPRGNLKHQMLS